MSEASAKYHILTEPRYKQLRPYVRVRDVDVSQFDPPPLSYTVPVSIPPPVSKRVGTGWIVFTIILFLILLALAAFLLYFFLLGGSTQLGININGTSTSGNSGNSIVSGLNEECSDKPCVTPFVCNNDRVCKSNVNGPCVVNTDCFPSNSVCSQGSCRFPIYQPCETDFECAQGLDCVSGVCTQL